MKQVRVGVMEERARAFAKTHGTMLSRVDPDMEQYLVVHQFKVKGQSEHRLIVSICKGEVFVRGSYDEAVDDLASAIAAPLEPEPMTEPEPVVSAPVPKPKKKAPAKSKKSGTPKRPTGK